MRVQQKTTGSTVKRETGCLGELNRIKPDSIESTMPIRLGHTARLR